MPHPDISPPGLLIAAPSSGSGKTTITLALLRRFQMLGRSVASIKVGPDYIDPAFHAAASGRVCTNLDSWAMRDSTLLRLVEHAGYDADFVLGEGVMGLFDGAPDGRGSTADLARLTGWPVVLVVDARGMAASAAAIVHGFASLDLRLSLAGVIFNRVGSDRHAEALQQACEPLGIAVLGMVRYADQLALPSRHLGLVQAGEHHELETFLDRAAEVIAGRIDCDRLAALAGIKAQELGGGLVQNLSRAPAPGLPPLGQRIAVARDTAFAFSYPFLLEAWRAAGAEVSVFSPLADESPDETANAIYLPGGYPELYAAKLAGNLSFLEGLKQAAKRTVTIYGECGGYMVLGEGLTDADGGRHAMAGLLPLETSFAPDLPGRRKRRLTLGYREATLLETTPLGAAGKTLRGHEFHYASEVPQQTTCTQNRSREANRLVGLTDARGGDLGPAGLCVGTVMGSFLHVIDTVG
ncbi:cobyrinate a,c-diamide synthase [Pelagibius sp. Alg239-R121]|uniref:cobyrinate a,c-diamide synthase n=1 Tax=Pelagibius sp. Alg239-R121 TaxID=2993448 RepID=UPI0024A740A4|nr:cobyrinate a,c-diamide synthase [Pelagibius sp. Alg239-R121]